MTMEVQIGLIGWEMAGTARPDPFGDELSDLSVDYHLQTSADAHAVVAQVRGYNEQAQRSTAPVVPVQWLGNERLSGYYRFNGASVEHDHAMYLTNRVRVKFNLERIRGWSAPIIEQRFSGIARSFVDATYADDVFGWLAIPSTWHAENEHLGQYGDIDFERLLSEDLSVRIATQWMEGSETTNETVLSTVAPADYYDGAVFLRIGEELHPHVGPQSIDPTQPWELSNGIVKLTGCPDPAVMFGMGVRLDDGSAWSTRDRSLTVYSNQSIFGDVDWGDGEPDGCIPLGITMVRNSPEEKVISLRYTSNRANRGSVVGGALSTKLGTIDVRIGLRRGARFASFSISSMGPAKYGLRWVSGFGSGEAFRHYIGGSGPQYGLRETTADSDGFRSLLMQGSAGLNLAGGRARSVTDVRLVELGAGVGRTSGDSDMLTLSNYLSAQTEVSRVVSR